MNRPACFLVSNNAQCVEYSNQLMRENFPNAQIRVFSSLSELQNSGLIDCKEASRIVVTDHPSTADFARQCKSYLPAVLIDAEPAKPGLPPEASEGPVAINFSQSEPVINAVKAALDAADQFRELSSRTAKLDSLAERERNIIELASQGVPNKTIAVRLGISIKTVEKNRRKAYLKLSVSSTAEMASLVTFDRFFGAFV